MTTLLIVTEGGSRIGLGHVRRCLTLASALKRAGVNVRFRVAGGTEVETVVTAEGFEAAPFRDPADAHEVGRIVTSAAVDGVLIDSYAATENVFRACDQVKTVAIDDLANRKLPVDMVINSTIRADRIDYSAITDARLLLGPKYALLRPEFAERVPRRIAPEIETIMITLGGSDHGSLARDVVQWCLDSAPRAVVEVVVGPFFEHEAELRTAAGDRVRILENPRMRDVMARADLAVSSGGQTVFELAATGLPAIVIATADNQIEHLAGFADAGTIRSAGRAGDPAVRLRFNDALEALRDRDARRDMSARGPAIVDGRGAGRVAEEVVTLMRSSRSAMA